MIQFAFCGCCWFFTVFHWIFSGIFVLVQQSDFRQVVIRNLRRRNNINIFLRLRFIIASRSLDDFFAVFRYGGKIFILIYDLNA